MLDRPVAEFKERGVDGRNIVVLHGGDTSKTNGTAEISSGNEGNGKDSESATTSSSSSNDANKPSEPQNEARTPGFKREVTFADEVTDEKSVDSPMPRLPQRLNPEQHIAFLENQRNPKDKGILRIPGPRDFDRGDVPVQLSEENMGEPLASQITSPEDRKFPDFEEPLRKNVTIEEPPHPRVRTDSSALKRRRVNSIDTKQLSPVDEKAPPQTPLEKLRSRAGTFSSMRRSNTLSQDPTPYLSWQPTIGRNSAFVDLTEEQREELGGIEYRSLKTLAFVLVCRLRSNSS